MSEDGYAAVRRVAEEQCRNYRVPGVVIAVARDDEQIRFIATGSDAQDVPLTVDTLFPVASITKLAVALTILRLANGHELDVGDPLLYHLPDALAAEPGVSLRSLLTHTSGLPNSPSQTVASYGPGLSWQKIAEACLQTSLETAPGERVLYSNVGYGLLAIVVERLTGQHFPDALAELVLTPLGIEAYLGNEPEQPPAVISGVSGAYSGTEYEWINSAYWRSLALPYGGLVTNAAGALALVRVYRGDSPDFLRPSLLDQATSNQAGDLPGIVDVLHYPFCPWGLGPDIHDAKSPHWAPAEASPASFGHAGSTGALAWSDPDARISWAILGTRMGSGSWNLRGLPAIGSAILSLR